MHLFVRGRRNQLYKNSSYSSNDITHNTVYQRKCMCVSETSAQVLVQGDVSDINIIHSASSERSPQYFPAHPYEHWSSACSHAAAHVIAINRVFLGNRNYGYHYVVWIQPMAMTATLVYNVNHLRDLKLVS